jgi:hypothetical protein
MCRDCYFSIVGQTPSLELGQMDDVYMCANDNGIKSADPDLYTRRVMKFYDGCGDYKDNQTGESFDEKYDFLSALYFERCRYIIENKEKYISYCENNGIDLSDFHRDFYWWKEIHVRHFEERYRVYSYQKFQLAEILYNAMTERI